MKKFDNIILIGSNNIACECAKYLKYINEKFEVIESQNSSISMLETICIKNNIKYSRIFNKEVLEKYLLEVVTDRKVLIISANNRYIFSKEILINKNVTIINFHYSLLPDYRGINIPTWVIFNDECKTGVTWHYVNENIDDGDIIIQEQINLLGDETALDITRIGMKIGTQLFKEFINKLLNDSIKVAENNSNGYLRTYKSNQLPQDGWLDLNKSIKQIYSLLRCYDYGILNLLPKLKVKIQNKIYIVDKYNYNIENNMYDDKKYLFYDNKISIFEGKYKLIIELKV